MRLVPYIRRPDPGAVRGYRSPLEDFVEDFFAPLGTAAGRSSWIPAVDVLEKGGDWILRAEIPGMNEKDIELKLDGDVLTLRGERKLEHGDPSKYSRIESVYGSFSRSFTLPATADRDKIAADYKNGVLTVTIPQKPESRPREIPVGVQ